METTTYVWSLKMSSSFETFPFIVKYFIQSKLCRQTSFLQDISPSENKSAQKLFNITISINTALHFDHI